MRSSHADLFRAQRRRYLWRKWGAPVVVLVWAAVVWWGFVMVVMGWARSGE